MNIKFKNSLYVISAYAISIIISFSNTLYLSRLLETKEFAIYGSILSIALILAGVFSYSQASFMVDGVKTKNLNPLTVNVASISIIPLSIFPYFILFYRKKLL